MKPWKQEVIAIAWFWPSQFWKDCYNVTIYIYYIYLSLSLRVLKRLVLHLRGYLQKNNVTGFCNKSGVFCYIVTQGKIIVVLPESYNLITFADFCPLGRPEALPHPRTLALARSHSHARSPAPPNYYDVFQTDNGSARMEKIRAKKNRLSAVSVNPRV